MAAAKPSPLASSSLPEAGAPGVLFLVDLSGYVFRAYHAIAPLSTSKGEPTHAVMGTVNMLQKVVNERRPEMLAVAMDARGRSFRKDLDARYKATRPAAPPDLAQQMARAEQIVRAFNIPVYQQEGLEADDLIAAVVARAVEDGFRVVIVSADKDLMQLVRDDDDRVMLWDSMRDKVYGPSEVREKFGVPPSKLRDLLALMGDTSDNIPGVSGVGPKTASDLLNQFGDIDGIYAKLDTITKTKLRETLRASEADARISRELVTLKADAPIDWSPEHLKYGGANVEELRKLFLELELHRMLDQLPKLAKQGGVRAPEAERGPTKRTYHCVTDAELLRSIAARARAGKLLALGTYTSSDDPMRGDLLGLSLATAPGDGYYVPIAHRYLGCPAQIPFAAIKEILGPVLADAGVKKIAHDLKRHEIVLARRGLPLEGEIFDTMLASYLLDPETQNAIRELARRELDVLLATYDDVTGGTRKNQRLDFDAVAVERATDYAAGEAEMVATLADRFEPRLEREGLGKLMREVELPLSRVLAQIEMHGVLVDIGQLQKLGARMEQQLKDLEAQAKATVGHDFSIRSRDQLEKILFDELGLPVLKRTPKGGRSTDADVLEALADKHPIAKQILEYREIDKLKGTYVDALPKCVHPQTGRIHTRFSQAVAATGRLSSNDPNLQNIPIRTEVGREIRAAFVAPPGYEIVSADYSQIELRVLAHLAKDAELIEAFKAGGDVHQRTAALVFLGDARKTDEVTDEMRRRAKTINFGVIYGMGDSALAKQIGVTRDEAARFIEAYFERYAGVARFMERTVAAARQGEAVRTLLGRRRFLPNLHSANRGLRFEAERIAKNTPIQGTAADILKLAMVRLGARPVASGAAMILTVHDELVFEVPTSEVAVASARIREEMASAVALDVPLVVDVGHGRSWNDAH